ncbi:type II secretion system protein K [Mizugakiibacter sediminis]|uniref:General secretion pathway protein GspK n=1 Tax=Mizugakiibacter sediminis TaxID=1475481 RepID=A0A0K8QR72_9GAMM|nr:type II secretion system protein GspK [Mizugakiibacter sediminis]GAP67136.1 type II secretion system protein K [Mizugakiibacter sediminis]
MNAVRGVALLVVLWAVALAAILLGGFAAMARTEIVQARYQRDHAEARYAAEAGLARAVAALRENDPARRWIPDGRPYTFRFEEAEVRVEVTDESGKLDLNAADAPALRRLFAAAGADPARAEALADAVLDWRDADDLVRAHGAEAEAYRRAHLPYGPRNGPFVTLDELRRVLGMDAELYRRVSPALTLWSGRNLPNPAYASALALQALGGIDAARAAGLVTARRQPEAAQQGLAPLLGDLPGAAALMAAGSSFTHSIRAEATLPDGARAVLHATVRLQGGLAGAPPYVVLRWQEGEEG